jgi:hypothetical protein
MATLTPIQPVLAGTQETAPAAAAAGGDVFPAVEGGSYLLRVINGGGSPITVTLNDPTSQAPGSATAFNPDVAVPVTNATTKSILINSSDVRRLRNPTTGNIEIAYSGVTTVTVQVQRIA